MFQKVNQYVVLIFNVQYVPLVFFLQHKVNKEQKILREQHRVASVGCGNYGRHQCGCFCSELLYRSETCTHISHPIHHHQLHLLRTAGSVIESYSDISAILTHRITYAERTVADIDGDTGYA